MQPLTNQQKIDIFNNPVFKDVVLAMNECKTPIPSLIGQTDFETVVNAITAEVEARFIANFITHLESAKAAKTNDQ